MYQSGDVPSFPKFIGAINETSGSVSSNTAQPVSIPALRLMTGLQFKRIAQQGAYGHDPRGVWARDEIAKDEGMLSNLDAATTKAKETHEALYLALKDPQRQVASRAAIWKLALPADWMAGYEDPEVVAGRQSLRSVVVDTWFFAIHQFPYTT
ncbi:hypothetical protein LTR84_012726 [Exophiala bonariae]|uniref:Uncharacterized protein n=1 Tax=Exophiala bonariae TaxID=1690606 RepID=A0AAV9NET8_9EURO|nr:hypothetical protein LTR84_012726 [Exophiala bonariae]